MTIGFTDPESGRSFRVRFRYEATDTYAHVESRCEGCSVWGRLGTGYAICHENDRFEKERGRKLALARALKGKNKAFRTQVWEAYFARLGAKWIPEAVGAFPH